MTDTYNYSLPEELIAQEPLKKRDSSRLMVLGRAGGEITHTQFSKIAGYFRAGDCLVLNNTRVFPARLRGITATGAKVEALLVEKLGARTWDAMMKNSRRLKPGQAVSFPSGLEAGVVEKKGKLVTLKFSVDDSCLMKILDESGETPLPPYITNNVLSSVHRRRYQTVYAKHTGSSAAPTAGLHFTNAVLQQLKRKGVRIAEVTLHVGLGTFEPVSESDIREHKMHEETYAVSNEAALAINSSKRVIAAGTTSLRVIEACSGKDGKVRPGNGRTGIFIYPGYDFRAVDGLITNFHLPKSTLIMLVCGFAGTGNILAAYKTAVKEKYRFFSYGDAMLII